VLWRWRDLLATAGESFDELKEYLESLLRREPTHLPKVLSMPAAWGTGPRLDGHQSPDELRLAFDEVIGTETLLGLARKYRDVPGATDPYGLVPQFLRMFGTDSSPADTSEE
jgi:hypothetical protein